MDTKRIFIGSFAGSSIFEKVYPKIQGTFDTITNGKWVEPENLHFTYYFLGNIEVPRIPEIQEGLEDCLKDYKTTLVFKGLGCFPSPTRPRVLYSHIHNSDKSLIEIHDQMGQTLESLGLNPEKRKFNPHLTLQRVKSFEADKFNKVLSKYENKEFGKMTEIKAVLIQSKLTRLGPVYTIL